MFLPAKIRHMKIEKRYPLIIGTIPIQFIPTASRNQVEGMEKNPPMSVPRPLAESSHLSVPGRHIGFIFPNQPGTSIDYDIRKKLIPKLHYLLFNIIFIETVKRHILKLQLKIIFFL